MAYESVYASLGKLTEEMYLSLAKGQSSQMQDQLIKYHALAEKKIAEMIREMGRYTAGEMLAEYKKKLQILHDDFSYMKNDINSKYKIYLRGCGKAGKSTLLNALLSLDESVGSRMGRLPMTFIVDIYTDELKANEAEVRTIGADGKGKYSKMSRTQAINMENEEERKFSASKDRCRAEIERRCKNVYLEQEREDIERDVYLNGLLKTSIREIKWGIGKNNFFHNCVLIDTPGLSQELRFTNVIEDVKSYEVDGIIWVISSESLAKQEVIDAYKAEMKEMQGIYDGKRVIAVINMYGTGADYTYGSRIWKRIEKRAREIYCGRYGFDDLICINAKLAYDGNLSGNSEDIDKSNISGLRKVINEMFVTRSTETYHYDKLSKIDTFLANLYRETAKAERELEKKKADFDDKKNKINNQVIACGNLVREDKEKALERYLTEIKGRIVKNSDAVQTLGQSSRDWSDRFIRDEIVHADEIQQALGKTLEESGKKIYGRFMEQQRQSIISGFKTEQYAMRHFAKVNTTELMKPASTASFTYKPSRWEITGNMITDLFGRNDATKFIGKILESIQNAIKSPQDRLYDSIKKDLAGWAMQFHLTEPIEKYQSLCMDTLEKSMAQTCCAYSDVQDLLPELSSFNKEQPHMVWEKVGLDELIGGCPK